MKSFMGKFLTVVYFMLFAMLAFAQTTSVLDDAAITTKIKTKILADKSLSIFKIDVTTVDAVVHVSGNLDSDSQANTLIDIVQSVPGVKDIDVSKLIIKNSNHPLSDLVLTSKIKTAFINEKLFGSTDIAAITIHVETNDGIVYLTGTADNQQQINNAESIAKSISGVKDVKENIKIKE